MDNNQSAEADRQRAMDDYKNELSELVRNLGIPDAVVDYAAFLRLTTFGPAHLGDTGFYSLRMDGAEVVGIGAGPGCPVYHEFFDDIEMEAMADHQRYARLDLPTTVQTLLNWIFEQAGDVEMAIPDSDEYPLVPARWVEAVARLALRPPTESEVGATVAKSTGEQSARATKSSRNDRLRAQIRQILQSTSSEPSAAYVMNKLLESVGTRGSCVIRPEGDGFIWKVDGLTEKPMTMDGLRTRLRRLTLDG